MKRIPFPKSCVNTSCEQLTAKQLRALPVLAKGLKIGDDSQWNIETTESDSYGYGRVLVLFERRPKEQLMDIRAAWLLSEQEAEDVLEYTHDRHLEHWQVTLERLAKLREEV